ncbi:hypothetical protein KKKH24_12250 [Helicobacter pylori]
MLYPFLKIPLHYSANDRARKVRKIKIKKRKQWGLAKKSNPQKKGFFIKPSSKKRGSKKKAPRKRI